MEKQRKKKARKNKVAKKVKSIENNSIAFKAFFDRCVRLGQLQPWQEREIEAFFTDMKLRAKEDLDTYQKMLEKY